MYGGSSLIFIIPMIMASIVGVGGTAFGAWMTYRANRRTSAGTVATSNANELWAENSRLMDRLTREIDKLSADVTRLQNEITKIRDERDALRQENIALRQKLHELEVEMLKFQVANKGDGTTTTTTTVSTTPHPTLLEEEQPH